MKLNAIFNSLVYEVPKVGSYLEAILNNFNYSTIYQQLGVGSSKHCLELTVPFIFFALWRLEIL